MVEADSQDLDRPHACACFTTPSRFLIAYKHLGMDSRFGEASLLFCTLCGQHWLRYFYEEEAFTGSGRWYLGPVTAEQAANLSAETAVPALEKLPWYYYGGSYYDGKTGKTSGRIFLNP